MKKNFKIFLGISLLSLGTIGLAPILTSCADWSYGDVKISEDILNNSNNFDYGEVPSWSTPNTSNNNTISTPSNPKPITPNLQHTKPTYEHIRKNPRKYHISDLGYDHPYLDKSVGWTHSFDTQLKVTDTSNMEKWLEQYGSKNYKLITDGPDKKPFYSVWAKGIDGLRNWKDEIKHKEIPTQKKVKTFITPDKTRGLFNTSKTITNPDDNFDCMSGVQTNWIFWWLYANQENLKTWLKDHPNDGVALDGAKIQDVKYRSDWDNTIFNDYMLKKLPDKYASHDTKLLKWFFMGDERMQSGGYLRELWQKHKDSIKKTTSISIKSLDQLNKALTWNILNQNAGSLTFSWLYGNGSHIITIYGVDFDMQGNVIAIWVSDSDTSIYEKYAKKYPPQIERLVFEQQGNTIFLKNRAVEKNIYKANYFGSFAWDQNIWNNKRS